MQLHRRLGLAESFSLVVGTVIGTGVFLKTATMTQETGSLGLVLLAWLISAALSFMGALVYAELGSRFPKAGGEYVFLRECYGPMPAFLFGWMRFWIGAPGSIAAYAVASSTFLAGLFPVGHPKAAAIALIALFTGFNCAGVAFGGRVQTLMTGLKIVMIIGLSTAIFVFGNGLGFMNSNALAGHGVSGFGAAMLAALWAFDGWNNLPMAAGEIREPKKVIPLALGFGMLAVTVIYVLANVAYFYALPLNEIAKAHSTLFPNALPVATKAAMQVFGSAAVGILSAAFAFSALGAMNGSILANARVPFAMARDGLFFRSLGSITPGAHVPRTALIAQGAWASVLAVSGSFDQLTDYVVFSGWIFYALNVASLFLLRRKAPTEASFVTPFYPWPPILFLLCAMALLINTAWSAPRETLIGLTFLIAGIPFYFVMLARGRNA